MKVRLTKLSDNVNALRTAEVHGDTLGLPKVGYPFLIYTTPLDEEFGVRYVRTSVVTKVYDDGSFDTLNSKYRVDVAEEEPE